MILILGGTAEARALAARLVEAGEPVVSSLAGAVSAPRLPPGEVRIGGFGGAEGLAAYLAGHGVERVIDATHPFAEAITANAVAACSTAGVPLLRLSRPGWSGRSDAATWHWVPGIPEARSVAEELGERVFLSVGRGSLRLFDGWAGRYVLARVADAAGLAVPPAWELIRALGPFDLASELDLLRSRRIDVLVTKDSGGEHTVAKLDAAAELGVAVVMVQRPQDPPGLRCVESVEAALEWALAG